MILEGVEEMEDKYWSLLLWLFPFITLYYGTRKKNIHKYYNDPEFEAFRRITPFSTKVNFYIWGIIVIGGSIFLIITLSMVVLYQFGIID